MALNILLRSMGQTLIDWRQKKSNSFHYGSSQFVGPRKYATLFEWVQTGEGIVPGIASLPNTLLDFRAGALEKGFPWEKRLQWFLDKSSKAEIIQFLAIQWPNYFWQHFLCYGYLHLITVDIFAYCVCSQNFRVMRDCWPNKWLLQFAKRKDILNELRVNRKDWLLTDF